VQSLHLGSPCSPSSNKPKPIKKEKGNDTEVNSMEKSSIRLQREHSLDQNTDEHFMALGYNGNQPSQLFMASPMSVADQWSSAMVPSQSAYDYRRYSKPPIPTPLNHDQRHVQASYMGFFPESDFTMQPAPHYPPPNYSEATKDSHYNTHLPPNYDSIM
jgi:hypothetical protein